MTDSKRSMATFLRSGARSTSDRGNRGDAAEGADDDVLVSVRGLRRRYRRRDGSELMAIDNIDFDVRKGEFVVLLGPSGCGKTTLLRSIAGVETPDSGSIVVNGQTYFGGVAKQARPPERRQLSMLFQSYALWPHMTAFNNIAYPLRCRKVQKSDIEARVTEILRLVGIAELRDQYPGQMSGGQQQRVALARALVSGDDLILFDEPLSNVDAKVREQLRADLAEMQRRIGFTAIYVTHDQVEAMQLADRIAVMRAGAIEHFGSPEDVYRRPQSRYVANFVGALNQLPGTVIKVQDPGRGVMVSTSIGLLEAAQVSEPVAVGQNVTIGFRPESVRPDGHVVNGVDAEVGTTAFLGAYVEDTLSVGAQQLRMWSRRGAQVPVGSSVKVSIDPADVIVYADEAVGA